jgi:hypothetical protein
MLKTDDLRPASYLRPAKCSRPRPRPAKFELTEAIEFRSQSRRIHFAGEVRQASSAAKTPKFQKA